MFESQVPSTYYVKNHALPLTLTPKQKELLMFLLEMKFTTTLQAEDFLGETNKPQDQIKYLIKNGYVKIHNTKDEQQLVVPTEKAREFLKTENPDRTVPTPLKRVFDPTTNHDLKLVALRTQFEKIGFIKHWFSEKLLEEIPMMKRSFQDLPDALCLKKNGKSYFLELEISQKAFAKYEERIQNYQRVLEMPEMRKEGIEGVIFLCIDPKVLMLIKEKLPATKSFSALPYDRYMKETLQ